MILTKQYDDHFPDLESRLRHLAEPLPAPEEGDWLAEHDEEGQTFAQYQAANPVRRGPDLHTIYLCPVGEFDEAQERILQRMSEYLGLFFDVPVQIHRHIPLAEIPAKARRRHPEWGDKQLLSPYILHRILEPARPDDALAYLGITTRDLWPGKGWNFVFGQANLRKRIGVWSIHRNGYPGKDEETFRLCLRRTLMIAAHETCHVLTMMHCTVFRCVMNGSNSQEERDRTPLHPCPVCLRKLLWNLQAEPAGYLTRLAAFIEEQGLEESWFASAAGALKS